jgi:hypothetical protein
MNPLAIDLFCGLGGWTEGLLAEGYEVIGFDIERHDYGTGGYPAQLVLQDVLTLHGKQFKNAALIVASPPCQAYSYRAMPWKRAKALPPPDNTLFEACFRIQREAIEAAGHFIPMVVENVRGAQKWVGRARWHYGSFYLWGDVPALMPPTKRGVKVPVPGGDSLRIGFQQMAKLQMEGYKTSGMNWSDRTKHGQDFTRVAGQAIKNNGGSWFAIAHNTTSGLGNNPARGATAVKFPGFRFDGSGRSFQTASVEDIKGFTPNGEILGKNTLGRKYGSKSMGRKAASAAIAKIPFPLAQYIAQYWKPGRGGS